MSDLKVKKPGEGHQHPAKAAVENTLLKEETARMNVNLPKRFYKEVKAFALANDTNVTNVVAAALREYMSR